MNEDLGEKLGCENEATSLKREKSLLTVLSSVSAKTKNKTNEFLMKRKELLKLQFQSRTNS
jgi:hypothetical protein